MQQGFILKKHFEILPCLPGLAKKWSKNFFCLRRKCLFAFFPPKIFFYFWLVRSPNKRCHISYSPPPSNWGGAIKVYVYFIRRELLLKWPKNKKWKKKKNHCYFGVSSSRNLAKTPPLAFLGQSQPVVGSMWKNEQFFGDLNFHKSEPHQHQSCKN